MIVDTGAQMSVVEASRAIAVKADVFSPKEGTLRVTGVGGDEHAGLARFDSAQFGPIDLKGLVTVLRRQTSELQFGGFPLGRIEVNLLGAPVLTSFSFVTFDYPGERFVFSGGTEFVASRGALRIPLTVRDSLPYVTLRVGRRTIPALVDTGARDQLFLNDKVVSEWGLDGAASKGRSFKAAGLGGMISGKQFTLPLIHLGGVPVRDVMVDTSSGPWSARIGSELLERWRTTFDFRAGALWLEGPAR
jgi:predicted aspartyl protease